MSIYFSHMCVCVCLVCAVSYAHISTRMSFVNKLSLQCDVISSESCKDYSGKAFSKLALK